MSKKILFVLILSFCVLQPAFSQEFEKEKDSARMYKSIENFSKKSKFAKFVHRLVFKPVQSKKTIEKKKEVVKKRTFSSFEGKIIRNITIVTLDPFGYSEKRIEDAPTKGMSKFGNRIHIKSRELTIKNLLLFRKNRPLDSLLVRESERLVRSQRYIRGVQMTPELISIDNDSVDVNIRVLDSWSLIPDLSYGGNEGYFDVTERNFLGTGHQFENTYRKDFGNGDDAYSTRYTVPNILNTYIRTSVAYQINLENDYTKSVNVERPFFSPFAKWAAGVYLGQQFWSDTLPDPTDVFSRQFFKHDTKDLWAGHSYQIFRGNSEGDRTTNLITTARLLDVNFKESPGIIYDPDSFYADERFYLVGLGISSRQFIQDKFIFNYGITEDVPVGRVFTISAGRQEKNLEWRTYIGGRASIGKFYEWGYLSSNLEYGTFFRNKISEQSALSLQINYFTNLIESSKWKFRQFVKARMVLGNNRNQALGDKLTINDTRGIPGFNAPLLYGTKKVIVTLQTQGYSPWNLGGFRLNPYVNYSMALLGDEGIGFSKSRMFSQVGIGLIISNDYLVFSQFQLSLAYYPSIPGNGENVIKTNAFNTEDFGFQNFEISKPRTVDYQ